MPINVWAAYEKLEKVKSKGHVTQLIALISLRVVCGLEINLLISDTARKNFQKWIMTYHSSGEAKFNKEQMEWLQMIHDHIASSFHIEKDDFDLPLMQEAALGKCISFLARDDKPR